MVGSWSPTKKATNVTAAAVPIPTIPAVSASAVKTQCQRKLQQRRQRQPAVTTAPAATRQQQQLTTAAAAIDNGGSRDNCCRSRNYSSSESSSSCNDNSDHISSDNSSTSRNSTTTGKKTPVKMQKTTVLEAAWHSTRKSDLSKRRLDLSKNHVGNKSDFHELDISIEVTAPDFQRRLVLQQLRVTRGLLHPSGSTGVPKMGVFSLKHNPNSALCRNSFTGMQPLSNLY
jgi:hypothetical protein